MGALKHEDESEAVVLRGPYTIADYIVARMASDGLSQRNVATKTGFSRSRINRVLRDIERLPISIVEANTILGSMGVGQLEVALANEMIQTKAPVSNEEMGVIIALIAVVVDGLPTKVASLLGVIEGLECSDIRKEHGLRIHNAIYEMLRDLYTDLTARKDLRIDYSRY